jgi:glycosyltransferase involved in cell wall biosynthesis
MKTRFYPLSILPAKILSKRADWGTFLTEYQQKRYCEKLGYCPKTFSIIPNVIPKKEISEDMVVEVRKEITEKLGSGFCVIYAGRLIPSKQIDMFIRTIESLRKKGVEASGVIVGDGPAEYVKTLWALAQEAHVGDKILFTGFKKNPEEYIAACDYVLFPTQHKEALPNLLIESFSLSKTVVVSDIPPLSGLVQNLENAVVVSEHNPDAYANALLELYRNPDLSAKISKGASMTFRGNYAPETVCKQYLEIYQSLLAATQERV